MLPAPDSCCIFLMSLSVLMKIFFFCGHSSSDMTFLLINVQNLAGFLGKSGVDLA